MPTITFDQTYSVPSNKEKALWVYNALDCCVTHEVWEKTKPQLDAITDATYQFEKKMLGPALDMMRKGVLVDPVVKKAAVDKYEADHKYLYSLFTFLVLCIQDEPCNIASPPQVQHLFYKTLRIPEFRKKTPKGMRPTCDRATLEDKISQYFFAQPFVNCILSLRDIEKKLQTLRKGIDHDGRLRVSYNVGATETGRWSSSGNAFRTGTSFHTITDELRRMVVPDVGCKLAYLDLATAESRGVGYLSGDEGYIRACESGDLHSTVARMVWPELRWETEGKSVRDIAETPYYRHWSYRDMSKRGGHLSNYLGSPYAMAKALKIPLEVAQEFQLKYFRAFPDIARWHEAIARLLAKGYLVTPFGRRRTFFDRLDSDECLREAIAYVPQSTIADLLVEGMYRAWLQRSSIGFDLLGHIHDAILIQYPEQDENQVIPAVSKLMTIPITVADILENTRELIIPVDAAVGYNWAKADPKGKVFADKNPGGLADWSKVRDGDISQSAPEEISLLDQRLPRVYARHGGPAHLV